MDFIKIILIKENREILLNKKFLRSITLSRNPDLDNDNDIYVFKTDHEILEGKLIGKSGSVIKSHKSMIKVQNFLNKMKSKGVKNVTNQE